MLATQLYFMVAGERGGGRNGFSSESLVFFAVASMFTRFSVVEMYFFLKGFLTL